MIFYANDLMLAHTGSNALAKYIKMLGKAHGTKDLLVVARGKENEHLGMALNFGLKMGAGIAQHNFVKICVQSCLMI